MQDNADFNYTSCLISSKNAAANKFKFIAIKNRTGKLTRTCCLHAMHNIQ